MKRIETECKAENGRENRTKEEREYVAFVLHKIEKYKVARNGLFCIPPSIQGCQIFLDT
jgi:hypothetical protein